MRVLVACESSGAVRRAFQARGHSAYSVDLLPADDGETFYHVQGDAFDVIKAGASIYGQWDLIIAHPPCTSLAVSGNRWHAGTQGRIDSAIFVLRMADLMNQCADAWAIENPVGALSTLWRKPDQYIQPWQFGHGETKKTGFWLHNLAPLRPTDVVEGREQRVWKMGPSANRWKERSKTYQGIADAMAEQWGDL
jgi:site-specific DNA-cytosine methylase